jgi:hypothetical protein
MLPGTPGPYTSMIKLADGSRPYRTAGVPPLASGMHTSYDAFRRGMQLLAAANGTAVCRRRLSAEPEPR